MDETRANTWMQTEWWAIDLSWRVRLLRRKAGWAYEVAYYDGDGRRNHLTTGGARPTRTGAESAAFLSLDRELSNG